MVKWIPAGFAALVVLVWIAVIIALPRRLELSVDRRGAGEMEVIKSDFGENWPFTVNAGTIRCETIERGGRQVNAVTFRVDGAVFGLNGTADSLPGIRDLKEVWAPGERIMVTDPRTGERVNAGPPRKDIGPLVARGLRLCSDSPPITAAQPEEKRRLELGQMGDTFALGGDQFCTNTEDALKELGRWAGVGDREEAVRTLVNDGGTILRRGTQVKVLDVGFFRAKVREIATERECWVIREATDRSAR